MLSPEARAGCARYVTDQARHVIEQFGPRAPGSAGEREAQAYVATCLEEMGADSVTQEPFPVAAEAFMRFQTVAGTLLILSFAAYWFAPPLALLPGIAAFAVTWYQFVHYRLLLDPLYPRTESVNVYARWAPTGALKRRIVLNAHTDAAYEWRYHYLWPRNFPWLVRYLLLAMPVAVVAQVVASIIWMGAPSSDALLYLGLLQALCLPGFVLALFYTDFNETVPGANDNLSGVFLALGVIKALREAGTVFEHTEIACLITGSEEAGLRGAKAWAARHAPEMKDCDTGILVLDTI
ncbi:MAG: M28 family peptidase, partial [Gammaproteobacteria bacterium]|nr:M28 family peptidase [Gammaproteobacteria bacterium]